MYLFYAWLWQDVKTFEQAWPVAVAIFFGSILLAYCVLKVYDEPARRYLIRRFLRRH